MSCFIVTGKHVDFILSYLRKQFKKDEQVYIDGVKYKLTDDDLSMIGNELLKENYRSFNSRYNEKNNPEKYNFIQYEGENDFKNPASVKKALDCLTYQSCECDDYRETRAYKLAVFISEVILDDLSRRYDQDYDNLSWEIID